MTYFFEETYDPRGFFFPHSPKSSTTDPTSFDDFKNQFTLSDVRSMSRSSIILRSLARHCMTRVPFDSIEKHSIGVYLVGEEGTFSSFDVEAEFSINDSEDIDTLRKIPPKSLIGLPISMAAAQVEVDTGATGPIVCADLGPSAIEFILDEIQSDFDCGQIKSFFIGAFRGTDHEAAWLVFTNSWGQDLRIKLKEQLKRIINEPSNR